MDIPSLQSSASSAAMFANLHTHKRGSEDYGARQQSISEMGAKKGTFATLFDKVIKK